MQTQAESLVTQDTATVRHHGPLGYVCGPGGQSWGAPMRARREHRTDRSPLFSHHTVTHKEGS